MNKLRRTITSGISAALLSLTLSISAFAQVPFAPQMVPSTQPQVAPIQPQAVPSQQQVVPANSPVASAQPNAELLQTWEQLQSAGETALRNCEYGNAERILKRAVVQARKFGPGDARFAKSSGELGRLLTIRGRFAEAEPFLEEELCLKDLGYDKDGQLIPAMGSLVRFYLRFGTATKAEPLTEEILSFVEGKVKEYNTQGSGKMTLKAGQPLQAWAGSAAPVARDPLIEWAIACDDLGNLFMTRESYDMAERLFRAALDMKSTVLGKDHLSLANSYDSLGAVCQARGDFDQSELYMLNSIEITEKILDPTDPKLYARQDKLAKCLIKQSKFGEAEDVYVRAKAAFEGAEPSTTGIEQRNYFSLGCLYCDQKKYEQAAPELEKAMHLAEEFHGVESVQLVPYLRKYAYVLYYLNRKPEMEQLKAWADAIQPPVVEPLQTTQTMQAGVWPGSMPK